MAGIDTEPLSPTPAPHDGQAFCAVCSTHDAAADHEWCAAMSALVCRTCCQRALLGDVGRMMAVSMGVADDEDDADRRGACAECERGRRWFADHVLGFMARGSNPS